MKTVMAIVTASLSMVCLQALGDDAKSDSFDGASKDAWITGRIETLYEVNTHLNAFQIDADVDSGIVTLTGMVENDIDRDLAGELAKRTEGVVEVKNEIEVRPVTAEQAAARDAEEHEGDRSFFRWVDDATTTAAVKSKLVGNDNTRGLQIDVDTRGDVVTLSGRVASAQERELAEEIARNTGDVRDVRNELVIDTTVR
jgi:hyperosmotically inducible periplasmic protein